MKKLLILLSLAYVVMIPAGASAAGADEPTIYVVKQGDTLWGLSERFIKDPFYWPNMWSKNRTITNPHLIYPGQKVRIFPDRIEIVPKEQALAQAPAAKTAVPPATAVNGSLAETAFERTYPVYGNETFLMDEEGLPDTLVVGIHGNRIMAGDDDIVYTNIGTDRGAKEGTKFSALKKAATLKHPVSGEVLGQKMVPLGTLQLTDLEPASSRAIVTRTYQEVVPGAYLVPYREGSRREVALKMPLRELKGLIVDNRAGSNVIAAGDVVHIDLGSAQGAEVGNMLYIVRDVTLDKKLSAGEVEHLPQELLGALVILESGKKASTALVVKSIDAIYKGDSVISVAR